MDWCNENVQQNQNKDDEVWQQLQSPSSESDRLDVILLLYANQANQVNQFHPLQKGKSQMAQVVKQRLPHHTGEGHLP